MKANDRKHESKLDYFRFSVPLGTDLREELPLHKAFAPTGELIEPLRNYDASLALVCARVDWNSQRPEQKMLITMSGKDLAVMRELGLSEAELLKDVSGIVGMRVTRLDVAMDTTDTRLSPAGAREDFTSGKFETRARSISEIKKTAKDGAYEGHTVYVGSRQSEQFLRIYDKAAEQGTAGHLTRVELELKGQPAHEAMHAIIKHGGEQTTIAAFNRFFRWSNAAWQDIICGNSATVERLAVVEVDKSEEWLMRVALPAVIKAMKDGNGNVKDIILREFGVVARKIDLSQF